MIENVTWHKIGVAAALFHRPGGMGWFVYLLRRADNGMWVLPGGKLENETPEAGMRRELLEEVGISTMYLRPVTFAANPDVPSSPLMLFFGSMLTEAEDAIVTNAEPHKHTELCAFNLPELPREQMWASDYDAIMTAWDLLSAP